MCSSIPKQAILLFFIFLSSIYYSQAQVLLSEDFEGSFPPPGWTVSNSGQGNSWTQNTNPAYATSGTKSMICYGSSSVSSNTWAITSSLHLEAGKLYKISCQCRTQSGESQFLRLSIGNSSSISSQTTRLDSFSYYGIAKFTEGRTYYRADTSGNYNVGFHCTSYNNSGFLCLDDIKVEVAQPAIHYVNAAATGLNNGSTWQNAFTSLQMALASADKGDTIKVAKGVYHPAIKSIDSSFQMKEYLVMLGGYPSSGNPTDADRNLSKNETVLSGYLANYSHSKHIVTSSNNSNYSVIDGFVLQQGWAQNDYNPYGADFKRYGGGIYLYRSSTTIRNCIFKQNQADDDGASMGIDTASHPAIVNCFFTGNTSSDIYVRATGEGKFYNCIFAKDTSKSIIHCDAGKITFTNCVFFNNQFSTYAGGIAVLWAENNSSIAINNSIFYKNKFESTLDSVEILVKASQLSISNTITQNYDYGNKTLVGTDPKFRDTANIAGADGLMFTDDDGLQLVNPCSPAINAGSNILLNGFTSSDILGKNRVADGTTDIGAYEVQSPLAGIPTVLYVNKNATGKNDGSSWANAFTDLQKALGFCSDTIKVAAGTYFPSDNDANAFFKMQNHRVILGGYPGTGSPDDIQRNPATNKTILSGKLPRTTVAPASIIKSSWNDTTAVLDGFTVTGADGYVQSGSGYLQEGGAINIRYTSSPIFSNLIFFNNMSYTNGSAVVTLNSSTPRFLGCTFLSDSTKANSSVASFSQSAPQFIKCAFKDNNEYVYNTSGANSRAAYVSAANPVFDSCTFEKNLCGAGVIYNENYSAPVIRNCTFIDEVVSESSAAIYSEKSSPQVTNCTFIDTSTRYQSPSSQPYMDYSMIENQNNSKGSFSNCLFFGGQSQTGVINNSNSTPVFTGCLFTQTPQDLPHYAIHNYHGSPVYYNCVATGNGNVMVNDGCSLQITNCSFVNNTGSVLVNKFDATVVVNNSIFWKNVKLGEIEVDESFNSAGATQFLHSFTQSTGTNGVNGNTVGKDPRFINVTLPTGPDGTYFTADDGLMLCSCSPAINTGQNTAIGSVPGDVLNQPRIYNGIVDIGAYEFQQPVISVPKTYYVNAKATGTQTGGSWSAAYSNLQDAFLNPCADTIKIAAGVYKPAIKARDTSFAINHGLVVLGGYPDTGNPSEASRNTEKYETVVDGDIGIANDTSDNTYALINAVAGEESVAIEGLTFRNANNTFDPGNSSSINTFPTSAGGGLRAFNNKSLVVRNCVFENNRSESGAGIYAAKNALVLIDSCLFLHNKAEDGGGISSYMNTEAYLKKSVLAENEGNDEGGALYTNDMSCSNVVFYHNKGYQGAGAYVLENTSFVNCSFVGNSSPGYTQGVGLFNYDGSGKIYNCIFSNNYSIYGENSGVQNLDFYTTEVNNSGHQLDIRYSDMQSYPTDYDPYNRYLNIQEYPVFLDSANGAGADGKWLTDDDGLKLLPCSPCINTGSNQLIAGLNTDILNQPRVYNNTIDMGAYEYEGKQGPSVSVTASADSICLGEPVTFTATSGNGGTTPSYQWYVNGKSAGTNSNTFTSSNLQNVDTVKVVLTSDASACFTSDTVSSKPITMTVQTSVTPSVNITSSANNICEGTQVTFTATPVNGGNNPAYQWLVNDVFQANRNDFTANNLKNGDKVKAKLISNVTCAQPDSVYSNIIAMTVNPSVTPTGIIAAPDKLCVNDSIRISFTAGNTTISGSLVQLWENASGNAFDSVSTQVYNNSPLQFVLPNVARQDVRQYFFSLALPANTTCALPNYTDTATTIIDQLAVPVLTVNTPVITIFNPDAAATYNWQSQDSLTNQWQATLPAVTGISYTALASGVYRVKGDKGKCSVVSGEKDIVIIPTSLPQNPTGDSVIVHVYPNPANSFLIVDSLKAIDSWEVLEIISSSGHRVMPVINVQNQTMIKINISGLMDGLYMLVLKRSIGAPKSIRFIKQ